MGLGDFINDSTPIGWLGGMSSDKRRESEIASTNAANQLSANSAAGEAAGRQNASIYYGDQASIGADAANYRQKVADKVGQASGLANQMTQSANQQIDRSNAKAGMSGIDNTAQSIGARRDAQTRSNSAQQAQDQINLANYGKSIGAGISGTEGLAAAGAGKGVAATPSPIPSYGGGIFSSMGSIICTELYRQNKLTIKELVGSRDFRDTVSDEVYFGYLTLAKPVVFLMKKSDLFSNLWVGWAKGISTHKPNRFTRIMIPICSVIGSLKLRGIYVQQS
jgi:hypothetical protein